MDAEQIRRVRPELTRLWKQFGDCFFRRDRRARFPVYVNGQLSDLAAKICVPIALAASRSQHGPQVFVTVHTGERRDGDFGGGLTGLPYWVRRVPRVRNRVHAKLLVNAARWFCNHPEVIALA